MLLLCLEEVVFLKCCWRLCSSWTSMSVVAPKPDAWIPMHVNTYMRRHVRQAHAKTPTRACVISAACWSVPACGSLPHMPGERLSEATQSATERDQKRRIHLRGGCCDGQWSWRAHCIRCRRSRRDVCKVDGDAWVSYLSVPIRTIS